MSERVLIVGGDAGGMAAVSQIRKGRPDAEIVALEKGRWTSYSACGIPFVVGGQVESPERLVARTPEQHRRAGIDLRMGHEAIAIDVAARSATVRSADGEYDIEFDQLLLGTGGTPIRPPLPGIDLPMVHGVQTLDDAAHLLAHAETGCVRTVVVGSGYIGLEMAESFVHRGCPTVVLEMGPTPLGLLDPAMGELVATAMREHGIDLRTGVQVTGFDEGVVHTTAGDVPADLVILGIGVAPNSRIAGDAGLALGVAGAIEVDERQATSVEGIWAAGDCAESTHLITGAKVHMALGTYANKQARVAGINIGGGDARTPRVLGTAVTKLCDLEIGRTGLSAREAERAGVDTVEQTIESSTRAGYFPGATPITVSLRFEATSARLVGGQIVGGPGAAKRIDTVATAITAGLTAEQVLDLDLGYAPPFSPLWDPVAVAAREALKKF
jgi:NADPH-dependent 2,4-dienoyl-CoA reductase/sulfur reductase-like enzyme